ncbi:MAG: hypothetical protein ACYSR9_15490, partial [Planctomycetota bacterium]
MSTQLELIEEAHNRGILPRSKIPLYQEAVKRGLIRPAVDKGDGEFVGPPRPSASQIYSETEDLELLIPGKLPQTPPATPEQMESRRRYSTGVIR